MYFISFMYTDRNYFNGTIPSEMFQLKYLKEVTLGKISQLHIWWIVGIDINLTFCNCLDWNRLTGPLPDFPPGSNLEVISAGRFFVGCIFVVQRDADLWNIPLVYVGDNGGWHNGEYTGGLSSTLPSSISNLRHTRVFNFSKWIKHW